MRGLGRILLIVAIDANGFVGSRGGYSDPELDRMIEAAVVRADAGREGALQEVQMEAVRRLEVQEAIEAPRVTR